jgi:hypothetical protein
MIPDARPIIDALPLAAAIIFVFPVAVAGFLSFIEEVSKD